MIWKAYKYVYYWLYTWQKKLWGGDDLPEYTAIFGMGISFMFNIYSSMALIYIMTDVKMFPNKIDEIQILSFGFSILLIHYFLFVYKYKYKQIEEEFKHESQSDRKRKGIWVLIYTFGSIVLYALLGFLGIWLRNNGYTPLTKFLI